MLDKMRDNAQSWGIKILFAIIILAFVFAFAGPGGDGDQVMAYVNGEPISVMEFERALQAQESRTPEVRRAVLGTLARNELLRQFTSEHGIIVTDAEVRSYIRSMPAFQQNGMFNLELYKSLVRSPEAFEQETKDELLKGKMARFLSLPAMPSESEVRALYTWQNEQTAVRYALIPAADYLNQASVEPEEIKAFYDNNAFLFEQPARAVFDYLAFTPEALSRPGEVTEQEVADYYDSFSASLMKPRSATYSEIIIPVGEKPTQESVNAATARARTLLEELAEGASFEELARANARPANQNPAEPVTAAMDDLPEAVSGALAKLEPGAISSLVPTADGLAILKLHSMEEARPFELEEARDIIVERISEQRAAERLDDMVEEAMAAVSQGKSLAETADLLDMQLLQSEPMTLDELVALFPMDRDAAQALFEMPAGDATEQPLPMDDGYLLARKDQNLPAMTQPLADVRAEITAKLMLTRAKELAAMQAEAILLGEEEPGTLKTSAAFTRNGPVPVTGINPQIIQDAFAAEPGEWLPSPYAIPEGLLVAKSTATILPDEATWLEQKPGWTQTAGEIARRELNLAFQQQVFTKADAEGAIEVVRADLLQ